MRFRFRQTILRNNGYFNTCAGPREFKRFGIFCQRNLVSHDLVHLDLSAFKRSVPVERNLAARKEPLIVTSRRMISAGLMRARASSG